MALTPTFHVYEMYRAHQGAQAVKTELESSPVIDLGNRERASISVSASRSGPNVVLTLVNQDPKDAVDVSVNLVGGEVAEATARSLSGPSVRAENTVEAPNAVAPEKVETRVDGRRLRLHLPPGSVQAVRVRLMRA